MKIGFLLAKDSDWYFSGYRSEDGIPVVLWTKDPGDAHLFSDLKYADNFKKGLNYPEKTYVVQLIESETTFYVSVPPGRVVDSFHPPGLARKMF